MNLTHYAHRPTVLDRSRVYDQSGRHHGHMKPGGLWVSVDGEQDWPEWCLAEDYPLGTWPYRVTLRAQANVLTITSGYELDYLHALYSYEDDFNRRMRERGDLLEGQRFRVNQWPMDWCRMAGDYQGLIIAPYLWSHRFGGPFWYYGWDCASGCIWDLDAISTFEPRHIPALQEAL